MFISSIQNDLKSLFNILDTSTIKLFSVTARFFKKMSNKIEIVDMYLSSEETVRQTGEVLWSLLSKVIKDFDLNRALCWSQF